MEMDCIKHSRIPKHTKTSSPIDFFNKFLLYKNLCYNFLKFNKLFTLGCYKEKRGSETKKMVSKLENIDYLV